MAYLLDTNTCIEYLRQRNAAVIARLAATPTADLRVCSVVKAELYYGAHRSQQAQHNLVKVEDFLRPFASVPFEDDAAREYGRLRAELESPRRCHRAARPADRRDRPGPRADARDP